MSTHVEMVNANKISRGKSHFWPHAPTQSQFWPQIILVAVARPWITRASSLLNASALRSNATALGLELLVGPVPFPAANKSFWSIAYPEKYYDPQCQKRPRMLIEDCE